MSRIKTGFTQKKYFKLKDGASTFRLLPPMEEMGNKGQGTDWSKYYKVHYGYKNTAGKLRIFQSTLVENKKTKMVEVPDAADRRIKDLKAKFEEAKAAGNTAVMEKLGKLVSGQKPMYNLDANHYINAIDSQGNLGVLKLRHTCFKALEEEIKKLEAKGVDALALQGGREFTFERAGSGRQTTFKVSVGQETLNIEGVGQVNREKVSNLSEELIARTARECADLSKLYKKISPEDIERVVKSSDLLTGISPVIDELFDSKAGGEGSGSGEDDGGDFGDDDSSDSSGSQAAASQEAKAAKEAAAKAAADKAAAEAKAAADAKAKADAEAKAKVEAVKAEAAKSAAAAPKAEVTSGKTTAEAVAEMSDADFLKTLGL